MVHRTIARLIGNRRGATAVEFALGLPVLLGLTLGSIEIGYAAYANSVLTGAVRDAARVGLTGRASRDTLLANRVTTLMRSFPKVGSSPVQVTSRVYAKFDDVDKPEPFADANNDGTCSSGESYQDINGNATWDTDMARAGLGGPGEIVAYRISYPLRPLFGFIGTANADGKRIALSATTVIRNEPFGAATSPTVTARTC